MKIIKEIINFDCDAKELWKILTDVSRCDWVPSVDKIIIEDDCRVFEMEGIGQVREKILLNDTKSDQTNIAKFKIDALCNAENTGQYKRLTIL